MRTNIGTSAFGLRLPIIKKGMGKDALKDMLLESIKNAVESGEYTPKENDIIGITESIVARADNRYVTLDEIVESLKKIFPDNGTVIVYNPIFSRNRFSLILKAIARYFNNVIICTDTIDEVGNHLQHHITNVDYYKFYQEICAEENAIYSFEHKADLHEINNPGILNFIDCTLHPKTYEPDTTALAAYLKFFNTVQDNEDKYNVCTLQDICKNVSKYGLLGSNKAGDELLKLYPDDKDQSFVEDVRKEICATYNLNNVDVMIYGDGCYKDETSAIWEFADPVCSPAYTSGLNGTPAELKLKYLADDEFKDLSTDDMVNAMKEKIANKNVVQGDMSTQGTTPRLFTSLLSSLCDLLSGSGDKGTPVIVIQNYFKNYSED